MYWRYGRCYPSYEDYIDERMEYKLDEAKALALEQEEQEKQEECDSQNSD
jgi:hypothetical protein